MRMASNAPITATYDRASIRKQLARPIVVITRAAADAPTIRAPMNTALFRLTAFVRSSSGTSSM